MSRMLVVFALLTVVSTSALAQQTTTAGKPATPIALPNAKATAAPSAPAAPMDPARAEALRQEHAERAALNLELTQRIEKEHKDVQTLVARFQASTDPVLRLDLQKQIATIKKEGYIDLLRIQLRHAQATGRTDQAKELSGVIEAMVHPQVQQLATPVVRDQNGVRTDGGR